jgi:hypothetical protein
VTADAGGHSTRAAALDASADPVSAGAGRHPTSRSTRNATEPTRLVKPLFARGAMDTRGCAVHGTYHERIVLATLRAYDAA